MPEVSIILPTYNRAEAILRAVNSVLVQSFEDWELIVVDDGSTDGTVSLIKGLDPRIRVVYQANQGVYAARNNGLTQSRGAFITFLDSDDEWLPHYLELVVSFLRWSKEDHFVTTEFLQDWKGREGSGVRHDYQEIASVYPRIAASIGCTSLDLPINESDNYLRVYAQREIVGEWGRAIAERAGQSQSFLYRGDIFQHMRWGYLNWLPVTMLSRHALETVGPFTTHTRSAADYRFLALLSKNFRANMIGVVSAIKHESLPGTADLKQEHLAAGSNRYAFAKNFVGFFEEVFTGNAGNDPHFELIRCHHHLFAGKAAFQSGAKRDAIRHLRSAARWRPYLRQAYGLQLIAASLPSGKGMALAYRYYHRAFSLCMRFVGGGISVKYLKKKLAERRGRLRTR